MMPPQRCDQHAVWDTVAGYAARLDHHSPTAALEDVAEAAAPDVAAVVEGLRPSEGQRGVLVVSRGGVVALDLFESRQRWPPTGTGSWPATPSTP